MSGGYYRNGSTSYREKEPKAEPVRTLFVRGLPSDVKSREMYNLFRPYQGFQSASLSYPGEQNIPVSFVSFSDHDRAIAAMEQLQGLRFDPESNTRLRIELAKSNSKSKKRNGVIPRERDKEITEIQKISDSDSRENSDSEHSEMNEETVRSIFNYLYTEDELSPTKHTNHITKSQPSLVTSNTPCSTIFLGNFHAINRAQLESMLQSYAISFFFLFYFWPLKSLLVRKALCG